MPHADMVVIADMEQDLVLKLNQWKDSLEKTATNI